MEAKYSCKFCGKTNTRMEDVTQRSGGLFGSHIKIGEKEVIDENADKYYRCTNCGIIMCETCCERQGVFKKKVKVLSTKKWTECPKCGSKMVKLNQF